MFSVRRHVHSLPDGILKFMFLRLTLECRFQTCGFIVVAENVRPVTRHVKQYTTVLDGYQATSCLNEVELIAVIGRPYRSTGRKATLFNGIFVELQPDSTRAAINLQFTVNSRSIGGWFHM
jgi:hypothetical protein